ncbi:hypothetical protein [Nocardioides sp. P5_E3]
MSGGQLVQDVSHVGRDRGLRDVELVPASSTTTATGTSKVGYSTGIAENRIGTFPAVWARRPELTDLDGIVPPAELEHMRREPRRDPVV